MAEVKVGQKWKWFEDDEVEFVVLAVGEEEATIEYLGDGGFVVDRPLFYWDAESVLIKDVPQSVAEEDNQLSPSVYQFPNGVEVRHISAHLTSFGGQAVQYVCRSTRLDGVVKGLPVQDLKKAIQLLEWEVERLES